MWKVDWPDDVPLPPRSEVQRAIVYYAGPYEEAGWRCRFAALFRPLTSRRPIYPNDSVALVKSNGDIWVLVWGGPVEHEK